MPSVLLCDDSMFARQMTRRLLDAAGWEVIGEAEDGEDVVAKYRELRPELLLIDLVMPHVGGVDAIRRIRAEHPDARIVVCTAMGQESLVREALDAGARGFVVKPVQADRLVEAVTHALA